MANAVLNLVPRSSTRAKRFAIQIPVHYRRPRTPQWLGGRTENISYSGVLFRAESLLKPKTKVELSFELPTAIVGEAGGKVVCQGVVVRTEESLISGIPPALAVSISGYRMVRG